MDQVHEITITGPYFFLGNRREALDDRPWSLIFSTRTRCWRSLMKPPALSVAKRNQSWTNHRLKCFKIFQDLSHISGKKTHLGITWRMWSTLDVAYVGRSTAEFGIWFMLVPDLSISDIDLCCLFVGWTNGWMFMFLFFPMDIHHKWIHSSIIFLYNIVVKCLISWPPKSTIEHKVASYWCAFKAAIHWKS